MSQETPLTQALAWARANAPDALARFDALLRIPSISNDPAHADDLQHCAEWLCTELSASGLHNCCLLPTGGPPVVYGEWLLAGVDRPTVLEGIQGRDYPVVQGGVVFLWR